MTVTISGSLMNCGGFEGPIQLVVSSRVWEDMMLRVARTMCPSATEEEITVEARQVFLGKPLEEV